MAHSIWPVIVFILRPRTIFNKTIRVRNLLVVFSVADPPGYVKNVIARAPVGCQIKNNWVI